MVAEVDVAIKLVNDQNSNSKFNLETHFNSNPVIQSETEGKKIHIADTK